MIRTADMAAALLLVLSTAGCGPETATQTELAVTTSARDADPVVESAPRPETTVATGMAEMPDPDDMGGSGCMADMPDPDGLDDMGMGEIPGMDIMPPVTASVEYDDESFRALREAHPADDALNADLRDMYPEPLVKDTLSSGLASVGAGAYTMAFDGWIDVQDPDGFDEFSQRYTRGFRGEGSAAAGGEAVCFGVEFYDSPAGSVGWFAAAGNRRTGKLLSVAAAEGELAAGGFPDMADMEPGAGPLAAACGVFDLEPMRRYCEQYLANPWTAVFSPMLKAPWTPGAVVRVSLAPYPETSASAGKGLNLRLAVTTPDMLGQGLPGIELWVGGDHGRIVAARLDLTEAVNAELPTTGPTAASAGIVIDLGAYTEWG